MARTTPSKVRGIIDTDDDNIPDLTPFIMSANMLVTELCISSGYDDARLEMIERWLAAHFYAIEDPRAVMEQAGSVRSQYESKVDLGLNNTRYGQQAMLMDTAGNLAALNNTMKNVRRIRKSITWLGKPPCPGSFPPRIG